MNLLSFIKKNKIKTLLAILAIFNILFIHFYLPRIFIEPRNPIVRLLNKTSYKLSPNDFLMDYKDLEIYTKDGLQLNGYKIYSELNEVKGTVIFLHGIRAYKEHFLPMCKLLSKKGFNSVIIDLRGHGESGGTYCSFGYYEKYDIVSLMDQLILDKRLGENIGVWGQSLGGAIAIQTMAIDKRIKFGIIESTFSDLNIVSTEYLKRLLGVENKLFSDYLLNRAYAIAALEIEEVVPKESVKNITHPILLVHGTEDKRINIYHAKLNFKNIVSKNKIFIEVEGATHLNVWKKGGGQYFKTVLNFLSSNSNKK